VEVRVSDLDVLNPAEALPFTVSSHEEKQSSVSEDLRLKYRYLDLRRPALQQRIVLRHHLYQVVRKYFSDNAFVEVETPVLMKSTPEGARDYLVPSRVHPGHFYALPQSPQTYKQILMISGMDRYFQIVKCFRDEDLRADRQPEFTQVDVEISFATEELVFSVLEGLMVDIWRQIRGIDVSMPFERLTYRQAITRYGSDKPDTRFDMQICDLSDVFSGSPFRVFEQRLQEGGAVVGIRVPGEGSRGRGAMDRLDKDVVRRRIGAGGLIYFKIDEDGTVQSSVKEDILPVQYINEAVERLGGQNGDLILILAGSDPTVYEQMGSLRLHMGRELGLLDDKDAFKFLWVTNFPLVEWSASESRWTAMHHPFTSPAPEDMHLLDSEPGKVHARAYDLVLNGNEIGGGSIRIHDRAVQSRMFELLNIGAEEAQRRFGFLLDAFRYGAPPHGGIALGLDRIAMALSDTANIRDVIAFPKTQSAQEPMVQSPDVVDAKQLEELHIQLIEREGGDDK
jgi:aspartyl-tRNA synthetase